MYGKLAIVVLLSIFQTGCGFSFLSSRATDPVITDYQSKSWGFGPASFGVLSSTADRRSIFIRYPENPGESSQMCAEAPPDAIQSVASSFSASAKGSAPSGPEAEAAFAKALAVSSALGLYRSQGLQLLRDRSFGLCMALVQHHIDHDEYIRLQRLAERDAVRLIHEEMPAIKLAAAKAFPNLPAPALSAILAPDANKNPPADNTPNPAKN